VRRLLLGFAVLLAGCSSVDPAPRAQPQEKWTTYANTAHAYRISFPASWLRAEEVLATRVTDPHEIFSLSTHRARPGGERCGHVPENAMRDLGPADALLTLQERRGSGGGPDDRVRPFRLDPLRPSPANECAERSDIKLSQSTFRDRSRFFHVLAAFGPQVPPERREVLERVMESLVLEPPWRSRRLDLRLQPPTGWTVKTGRRGRNVTLGSYDVPQPPRGSCWNGSDDLPDDGAFVFMFEYRGLNRTQRMRFPRYQRFSLRERDRRAYGCAGDSWLFRFRQQGRSFQAHAYLGRTASPARRAELLAALRSITVTNRR
jgi:hypothetical protein